PGIDGLDQVDYLTTDTFFEMEELPDKFVTIGGGVIAVELAFALRKFGVEVTIIEVASDILLTLDHEAREIIKNKLKSIGIQIETSATIQKVTNQKVVLAGHKEFLFDELLVAAGREQNLDLPHAIGLELDNSNRFVSVDEYYET